MDTEMKEEFKRLDVEMKRLTHAIFTPSMLKYVFKL